MMLGMQSKKQEPRDTSHVHLNAFRCRLCSAILKLECFSLCSISKAIPLSFHEDRFDLAFFWEKQMRKLTRQLRRYLIEQCFQSPLRHLDVTSVYSLTW